MKTLGFTKTHFRALLPLLWLMVLILVASCKPRVISEADTLSDPAIAAAKEFEDLQLNLEIGFLGSMLRDKPVPAFFDRESMKALESEMKKSFSGQSQILKFLHCETRLPFPQTTQHKECDYVVGGEGSTFEFRFLAVNPNTGQICSLTSSSCRIHQVIKVLARNNGIQRPPVFVLKLPVGEKMLLMTHRVFYSHEKSVQNFFRRWTESDEFAPLVVEPYHFGREYGQDLAGMLGKCGHRFMNIVNLADEGIRAYENRKRPVVLSGIAAQAVFTTALLYIGVRAPFSLKGAWSAFKVGGRANYWRALMLSMDAIGDTALIPAVLADLGNWRAHVSQHPKGSPMRNAIETAIMLADIGDLVGFAQIGLISAKHWKATANILGLVAVGGGATALAIRNQYSQSLFEALRHGNTAEVRKTLCLMQQKMGMRQHCTFSQSKVSPCQ